MDVIIGVSDADRSVALDVAELVELIVVAQGGTINARVFGTSTDPRWGTEHAGWIAASLTDRDYNLARQSILAMARAHGQEAVAFTVGHTEVAETVAADITTTR